MRARREGARRTAGIAAGIALVAAGLGSALALAGGASGRQVPTTTITVRAAPPTTITASVPTTYTTTITLPTAPGKTVTTSRPPPPPAPSSTPPPPQPVPPNPPVAAPPPPVEAPTPAPPPATAPSDSSSSSGSSSTASETTPETSAVGPSGAAGSESAARKTRTATGPAVVSPDPYRPLSGRPPLSGPPTPHEVVLDRRAFIAPLDEPREGRRLRPAALAAVRAAQANALSVAGFPDFLRKEARAQTPRRSSSGFPDVRRVLADQGTIDLSEGGGLTFGPLPLLALSLVILSSLLLVGALLPPGVIAHTPVSPARFARIRQPLALAAIAILLPVAAASLAAALS